MTQEPPQAFTGNRVWSFVKQVFGYYFLGILPMTVEQRNSWTKTRAGGFLRYVLKIILINILSTSVLIGILWLMSDQIFDGPAPHTLKTYMIFGYSIGVLTGLGGAYLRWTHNEIEYVHGRR